MLSSRIILAIFTAILSQGQITQAIPHGVQFEAQSERINARDVKVLENRDVTGEEVSSVTVRGLEQRAADSPETTAANYLAYIQTGIMLITAGCAVYLVWNSRETQEKIKASGFQFHISSFKANY